MGAATTYTYSQVSNVSVEQIKKTFTLSNFKLIPGAIWLAILFVCFFACFYSFLREYSPPTA